MKLIIFTQKVDQNDTVFSFFHSWIIEFATHSESVIVVCLYEGVHDLPSNVRVYSLGKEKGVSRWTYILRFYTYIVSFRREYDAVFVHQNQEYVLLGAFIWKLLRKQIYL